MVDVNIGKLEYPPLLYLLSFTSLSFTSLSLSNRYAMGWEWDGNGKNLRIAKESHEKRWVMFYCILFLLYCVLRCSSCTPHPPVAAVVGLGW